MENGWPQGTLGVRVFARFLEIEMRAQVMDGRIISARQSDALLTTRARLNAEPNPPLPEGALGVLYTGAFLGGKMPEQADLDGMFAKVTTDPSMLSPIERAHIAAILSRFSGRTPSAATGVGIATSDAAPKKTNDEHEWARESARNVAAEGRHNASVAKTYSDFWDRHNQKMTAEIE